ncbi:hypothetical protein NBRC116602_06980 [Hyphomicrobiales bacterium 4NK60-0047b]
MKPQELIHLKNTFSERARMKHDQKLTNQREQIQEKQKRKQAERDEDFDMFMTVVLASQDDIQSFQNILDEYESKATERILDLQNQLDQQLIKQQEMLNNAYVLPDGRRVFKYKNTDKIIDEFGKKVSSDVIDTDFIPDHHPDGETYQSTFDNISKTREQRKEAIEFRDRVNEMQDEIDQGKVSEDRLNDLKSEFDDIMPDSLRPEEHVQPEKPSVNTTASEVEQKAIIPTNNTGL